MLKKTSLQCFFVMSVLCLGITHAFALMPPHIQSATPPNEGVLEGKTFVFSGYSLEYADAKKMKVILLVISLTLGTSRAFFFFVCLKQI